MRWWWVGQSCNSKLLGKASLKRRFELRQEAGAGTIRLKNRGKSIPSRWYSVLTAVALRCGLEHSAPGLGWRGDRNQVIGVLANPGKEFGLYPKGLKSEQRSGSVRFIFLQECSSLCGKRSGILFL